MDWIIPVVGLGLAYYVLLVLPTQWVRVHRVEHPLGIGRRFVQLSDLHVERLRVGPERLGRLLRRLQPDAVVLTGDYTEYSRHLDKVERYMRTVSDLGVPMYAVLGNHDYRLGREVPKLIDVLERSGAAVLTNRSVSLADGCRLVGVDDLEAGRPDISQAFRDVQPDDAVIVLTHNPNMTLQLRGRYDYLMCGDFHGMQVKLPFRFLLRAKGELMRRGIYEGLHRDGRGTFYISRGLGQVRWNVRMGVRSEVTVHEL